MKIAMCQMLSEYGRPEENLSRAKEMLRDGVTLFFGIAFPLILLLLMTAIQANIPVEIYNIERLAPGVAAFGLCFLSLFSAMLISKDRTTSFLMRLYSSPMTPADFILGYTLPLVPMGIVQSAVCFFVATIFRLPASVNILLAIVVLISSAKILSIAALSQTSAQWKAKDAPVIFSRRRSTSGLLFEKLSTMTTSCPAERSSMAVCEPIYPAPPESKTFIIYHILSYGFFVHDYYSGRRNRCQ